jgi:hypothetical protein
MSHVLRFERVEHFVRVPVRVGDRAYRFLVDSGAGLSVVSPALADAVGAVETGTSFSGRRMSGQLVTAPLVELPEVSVGGFVVTGLTAGRIDVSPSDGEAFFDGILGLDVFADTTLTIDPLSHEVVVGDDRVGSRSALVVPVEVDRDGPAVSMFAPVSLPTGRVVKAELDTGSQALILDQRFMPDCEVTPDDDRLDTRTGVDETGYHWTRSFVTIDGGLELAGLPGTRQERPRVMFQDIVHDGQVGTDFLDRYRYTFDVGGAQLLLAPL